MTIMEAVITFATLTLALSNAFAELDTSALLFCLQNALVILYVHNV